MTQNRKIVVIKEESKKTINLTNIVDLIVKEFKKTEMKEGEKNDR